MLLASAVPALVNTAVTFHMVSIMEEKGHGLSFGDYILSVTALTQMPMTFVAGFLLERVQVHFLKGLNFILLGGILLLLTLGGSEPWMFLYAMIHGAFMAFDSVSTGVLWSDYYGRAHLGKIRGLTMSAMVLGSALGPLPFGAAFDLFGGYREILLLSLVFPAFASIASFLSPAPVHPEAEAPFAEKTSRTSE